MLNALSIDVEEFFQVTGLEKAIARSDWDQIPSRLDIGLCKILEILDTRDTRATFFVLGWIAERHPKSVQRIIDGGHEIALHSYDHKLVYRHTRSEFKTDLVKGLAALRDVFDGPILGFRAPSFSIVKSNLWALDVLREEGFRYDSSIFPFRRKRYGISGAPRRPYEVIEGLIEFPMSTIKIFGKVVPVCGGGYFRLYPFWMTCRAIDKLNRSQQPVVVYLHPWEFDPDQPRVKVDFGNGFRHRVNLHKTAERLDRLCRSYSFAPLREVLQL